jgi:hypothetical protein
VQVEPRIESARLQRLKLKCGQNRFHFRFLFRDDTALISPFLTDVEGCPLGMAEGAWFMLTL